MWHWPTGSRSRCLSLSMARFAHAGQVGKLAAGRVDDDAGACGRSVGGCVLFDVEGGRERRRHPDTARNRDVRRRGAGGVNARICAERVRIGATAKTTSSARCFMLLAHHRARTPR